MTRDGMDRWSTKEGLTLVSGWAREGLDEARLAEKMGISRTALRRWRGQCADIADALSRTGELADMEVEAALLKRATGYEVWEERIEESDKGGEKVTRTVKHVPPDISAGVFWLKNRRPDRWRDKPSEERAQRDAVEQFTRAVRPSREEVEALYASRRG